MSWLLKITSYPRGFLAAILCAILTALNSVLVLAVASLIRKRSIVDFVIIWCWSMPLIWLAGAKVEVRGRENALGENKGFLILFNHSSMMDIPVLYAYFPRSFRFGAKIELFKIPLFGRAMKICGVLPIDRANRNKVMKVYDDAIERVHRGEAFALAPEGTRQRAPSLGKFKRGPFEFALNAGVDIVPVIIAGAYDILPKSSIVLNPGRWSRKVILQILPRVSTIGLVPEELVKLQERVREMMDPVYVQLNEELKGQA